MNVNQRDREKNLARKQSFPGGVLMVLRGVALGFEKWTLRGKNFSDFYIQILNFSEKFNIFIKFSKKTFNFRSVFATLPGIHDI